MDNATLLVAGYRENRQLWLRLAAVLAGVALLFALVVLVQDRADATTAAGGAVAAAVAGVDAQINFNQIFCAILLSIRNAFAGSPFFGFIAAAINALLIAFGCIPSPGV